MINRQKDQEINPKRKGKILLLPALLVHLLLIQKQALMTQMMMQKLLRYLDN